MPPYGGGSKTPTRNPKGLQCVWQNAQEGGGQTRHATVLGPSPRGQSLGASKRPQGMDLPVYVPCVPCANEACNAPRGRRAMARNEMETAEFDIGLRLDSKMEFTIRRGRAEDVGNT